MKQFGGAGEVKGGKEVAFSDGVREREADLFGSGGATVLSFSPVMFDPKDE